MVKGGELPGTGGVAEPGSAKSAEVASGGYQAEPEETGRVTLSKRESGFAVVATHAVQGMATPVRGSCGCQATAAERLCATRGVAT